MKSTFKRILAIVMVICTVAAWMIPGVSAADAGNTTYVFTSTPNADVTFGTSSSAAGEGQYWFHKTGYHNWTVMTEAYAAGKLNWCQEANSINSSRQYKTYLDNQVEAKYANQNRYLAIDIKAPGAGRYTMNVNYFTSVAGFDTVLAYIVEAPAEAFTSYGGSAAPGTLKTFMDEYIKTAEPVVSFATQSETDKAAAVAEGEVVFEIADDKEYTVIFLLSNREQTLEVTSHFYLANIQLEFQGFAGANADLEVDFATAFANAGVDSSNAETAKNSSYLQSNSNASKLNATYATNNWALYCGGTEASIRPNNLYAGGRNRVGYLEIRNNGIATYGATATIPTQFVAPGNGEYTFSIEYGTPSKDDKKVAELGAYILEMPATHYTKYNVPGPNASNILIKASKTNPYDENGMGSGTVVAEGTVTLKKGVEYVLVFYGVSGDGVDAYADFAGFSLKEAKPAASIGSTIYNSLADAVKAAQPNDVIKLIGDATVASLDLGAAILDLNGKTLTAAAVVGTVIDSADGEGLLKVAADAAVIDSAAQLALWDADAEGYRVFNYEFAKYAVTADQDDITAVNKVIDLYEAERVLVANEDPANLDENGEVIQFKGDKKFKDVADDLADLYAEGKIDWRLEYSSQQYQMGRGGVCFSWGNKSLRHFGNGFSAIRIQAPAEGTVAVTVKTSSAGSEANDGGFSMYILKASDIEAACADYAANFAAFIADPATAVAETAAAFTAAYEAAEPVLTGISNGEAYTGSYEFEAGEEYIVVFLNNDSVKGALHMNFQTLTFKRAEKKGATQTFWSTLKFSNADAYALVRNGASGLSIGYELDWNGSKKTFEFDNPEVMAWGKDQEAAPEKTYGLYIRVSGFEALTESGTLTGVGYIKAAGKTVKTDAMTYEFAY